jgi:hypothetical protein
VTRRTWWVKIKRAKVHAAELQAEFMRLMENEQPFVVSTRVDTTQNGQHWLMATAEAGPFPGDDIAAVVGDVISNTRAALDHVCVALSGNDNAAYPILTSDIWQFDPHPQTGKDRNAGRRHDFSSKTRGLPGPALALVKGAQPYIRSPQFPELHHLAVLNRLSNADKHRTLAVMIGGISARHVTCTFDGIEIPNHTVPPAHALSGAIVGVYPAPPPGTNTHVEASGGIEIALEDVGPRKWQWVLPGSIDNLVLFIEGEVLPPLDALVP